MKRFTMLFVVLVASLLTACASSNSGDVYKKEETRKVQTRKMGVVQSVRQVKIEGSSSAVGASIGSVVGGIAGGSATDSRARPLTAMLGALVGGILGAFTEEAVTSKDGLEITVALDNGDIITVVQEADVTFEAGDEVNIIQVGGSSRITH